MNIVKDIRKLVCKEIICTALTKCVFSKVLSTMSAWNKWPVCDENGYYQSYQKRGKWQNHWRENKPTNIKVLYGLTTSTNMNGAFEDLNINQNLPIMSPYWLTKECVDGRENIKKIENVGSSGIRATWIGHATVLAEIDGLNVLCDPVFSECCGPDYVPSFLSPKVNIIGQPCTGAQRDRVTKITFYL